MTPEQFLKFAQILPEPLLFVTSEGEILASNRPAAAMLNLNSQELHIMLFNLVTEPADQVIKYLQACSRSRQMVIGSLTFRQHDQQTLICRCDGAVIQPSSPKSPALNLLRLEKRASASSDFILLNYKIEVQQRKQAQAALSRTNQALQQTLHELQKTQLQLVQAEKMSSLAQLVAGIAHEINNPVSFIYGNITHIEKYIQDLLGLVLLYQQQYPHPTEEIQARIKAIELDFIQEDLNKLLNSMTMGTQRISDIVQSLRNFSRLDEAKLKEVDIHEGIESTLVILNARLKASEHLGIEVIKEYGQLPHINCYPSLLNQVFMNVLSNAIDALDEHNHQRTYEEIRTNPSRIWIHTFVLNENWVVIRIVDNGLGMTEMVRHQIFDPFFTTKLAGKATGLGLSISYQIITVQHGGQLRCFSKPGQGTEFMIEIPISRQFAEQLDADPLNRV